MDWVEVVLYVFGATSVGTGLINWIRQSEARKRALLIAAEVLERLASAGDDVKDVKWHLAEQTKKAGSLVASSLDQAAAHAEAKLDHSGSASKRHDVSKVGKVVNVVKKWLPIIGLFAK